jgi:hypothetical protein
MKSLAKSIIAVMSEVKGMEKNSKVGTGKSAYDGTKDSDVKEIFNEVLAKNGLCILPISIEESTQIDRWEQEDFYNGQSNGIKQKQSVFTKVTTKYLLLHESGESQVIAGYGHGVDPQDKGAGKATTYALKNALLYAFLTPVGKIDDTDKTHSNDINQPQTKPQAAQQPAPQPEAKPKITKAKPKMTQVAFDNAMKLTDVETLNKGLAYYDMTEDQTNNILSLIDNLEKGV